MACDNCKDLTAFYCPICAPTTPAKAAVCEVCGDPTCLCGKVVLRTDAELIDALRACRWILSQQVAAEKQLATLAATVDAIVMERDALRGKVARVRVAAIEWQDVRPNPAIGLSTMAIHSANAINKVGAAILAILNDKETP